MDSIVYPEETPVPGPAETEPVIEDPSGVSDKAKEKRKKDKEKDKDKKKKKTKNQ